MGGYDSNYYLRNTIAEEIKIGNSKTDSRAALVGSKKKWHHHLMSISSVAQRNDEPFGFAGVRIMCGDYAYSEPF